MKKNKFYRVLISLSKRQFYKLEFFLKYTEEARNKCLKFYYLIKHDYKNAKENWNKVSLNKQEIHLELFKKPLSANSSSLRELCSEFYKHLENYCAFIQFQQDKEKYYLKYLNEKGLNDLFEKKYSQHLKTNNSLIGSHNIWNSIKLKELYSKYEINNDVPRKILIEDIISDFGEFSDIKNLQLYCVLLQKSISRNSEIDENLSNKIQIILNKSNQSIKNKILYNLYGSSIDLLHNNNFDNYKSFKERLFNYVDAIANKDLIFLFNSLISFCNKQMKFLSGEKVQFYWSELITNYFYMYDSGLLNDGKYVPIMHVKNICMLSINRIKQNGDLKLSKDQVMKVIKESKDKTIPLYAESTYNFNMGVLYFSIDEYEKAIKLFESKANYSNYFFVYDIKMYLLICYYLTEEGDKFDKTMASFRELLRRHKFLSKHEKSTYNNTIKAFKKLHSIRDNFKYKYRYNVKSDIKKMQNYMENKSINYKNWLVQQLNSLNQKF